MKIMYFWLAGLLLTGISHGKENGKAVRGVNFLCTALIDHQQGTRKGLDDEPADWIAKSFENMQRMKLNTVRCCYTWEAYEINPERFMKAIDAVVASSLKYEIKVIFVFLQWETTSAWSFQPYGSGFPSFAVAAYSTRNTRSETEEPFWKDFWNNAISINGRSLWDLLLDLELKIVAKTDKAASVWGYEILNEPHLNDLSQFQKLGDFYTYLGNQLRQRTDKTLFFDMSFPTGKLKSGRDRVYENEIKIRPRGISNLVYAPHLYATPEEGSWGWKQLELFHRVAEEWQVPFLLGEFGVGLNEKNNNGKAADFRSAIDTYLQGFQHAGALGGIYWAWSLNPYYPEGFRIINQDYIPSRLFQYLLSKDTF